MKKQISMLVLCLAWAMGAQALVIDWTGIGADTEWNTVENWSTNFLPGATSTDRARFLAGDQATISSGNAVSSPSMVDLDLGSASATLAIGADFGRLRRLNSLNGMVTQTAGAVLFEDTASFCSIDNNGSWIISGGSYGMKGDLKINAGGTFSVIGSAATVSVGNGAGDNLTLSDSGGLSFTLDASGVSAIDVWAQFNVDTTNSLLTIDALAYEGVAASIDLVTFSTNIGTFATSNITVSGAKSWSVGYDADSMFLNLVPYGPGDIVVVGEDDFDGTETYGSRTLTGTLNSSSSTFDIVNRDTVLTTEIVDTSLFASLVVTQDVADVVGYLESTDTDNFMGIHRAGPTSTLIYTFNIIGLTNLTLAADWISGENYASTVKLSAIIDGGATNDIFSVVKNTANWNLGMEGGATVNLGNTAEMSTNGIVAGFILDSWTNFVADIEGVGTNLTLIISEPGRYTGSLGMDNLKVTGTVPGTPGLPEIGDMTIEVVSGGTEVALSWLTDAGYTYGVQAKGDLVTDSWDNIITNIPGTGFEVTVTNTTSLDAKFYQSYLEE